MQDDVDRAVEALRRLIGDSPAKRREVADTIGASEQSLYQICRGIKLQSGRSRSVGRELREKLDLHYPGWLASPAAATTSAGIAAEPPARYGAAPSISDALAVLATALRDVGPELREALAANLAGWARSGNADPWRGLVEQLLTAARPGKRTGTSG